MTDAELGDATTSAAEPFKNAVTSESDPDQGWCGGLERRRARRGAGGDVNPQRFHRLTDRRIAFDLTASGRGGMRTNDCRNQSVSKPCLRRFVLCRPKR